MLSFAVYQNGKEIDRVFYGDDFKRGFKNNAEMAESVRKSLIDHDGYLGDIIVRRVK